MKGLIQTMVLAVLGGCLFFILRLPVPWMLGPLTAILVFKFSFKHYKQAVYWPPLLHQVPLVILGYVMGSSFSIDTRREIIRLFPGMFVSTAIIIGISLLTGLIIYRYIGVSYSTGILGSIPGGLTQTVMLCEEIEGADISVVTFMQTIRLLTVVFVVPFLVVHSSLAMHPASINSQSVSSALLLTDQYPLLIFYTSIAFLGGAIAKKIGLPTPFLMGPMLCIAIPSLLGLSIPHLPSLLVKAAQIAFGAYLGNSIDFKSFDNFKRLLFFALLSALTIIGVSLLVGYGLTHFYSMDLLTAFLATSPGGMSEMAVTALSVNANLSIVTSYQLFRVLLINLMILPILKRVLKSNKEIKEQ
ncbi:MAG: AbrB family transcriptional regulator [Firmicutes bacterium HGW-Firmicutes-12]|nr:MAG: AbrB family transcriptional regulator [Firmicutes bacterium HGW-Firmicutes-12]